MVRLIRSARGALIALVLALLVAAPAAAAQPTRTVHSPSPVGHFPAGTGCEFDVTAYRSGRTANTYFSDGREVVETHYIDYTMVNDANGKTFVIDFVHHEVDHYDAANDVIRGRSSGDTIFTFVPGDVDPDGATVDHIFSIYAKGTVTYVVDGTSFATLAISIQGRYTDICAALSSGVSPWPGSANGWPATVSNACPKPRRARPGALLSHWRYVDGVTPDVAGSRGLGRHDFP